MAAERGDLLCPSGSPEWADAKLIGVVGGSATSPRVVPVAHAIGVTPELLALSGPVSPTEVFRFAATFVEKRCKNFQHGSCHVAEKIVKLLSAVSDRLPFCTIRASCRWF